MIKRLLLLALVTITGLTGCVTVNEKETEPMVRIAGVATYKETTLLPPNSRITVAIIDADKPGVVLTQKEFAVAKLPVPFFFAVAEDKLDDDARYVIWASVQSNGTVLLRTQSPFVEVINNDSLSASVLMKVPPQ